MARTPEKEGYSPPSAPLTGAPPPPYHRPPTPLTMIAPPEALARVYAAAYLAATSKNESMYRDSVHRYAREDAAEAVRDFCALCREKFEEPE